LTRWLARGIIASQSMRTSPRCLLITLVLLGLLLVPLGRGLVMADATSMLSIGVSLP
jgi:hypothetical protein